MKIITFEEHFLSQKVNGTYTEILKKTASPAFRARMDFVANFISGDDSLTNVGEKRIRFMDKAGVDIQIVSYGNNSPMHLSAGSAVPLCKQANDELAEYCRNFPNRFYGFAVLPVDDAKAAADELGRCVNELGFKGAMFSGTFNDHFLDEQRFFPIFKKAAELGLPLYLHPGEVSEKVADYYYKGSWTDNVASALAAHGYGWHVDAGIHIIRMILSGIFDKLPDLKLISGHWGELVPYFLERIDETLPKPVTGLSRKFSEYYKDHIFVTPSGMFYDSPFKLCLHEMGADHILWAMDYPYVKRENTRTYLENFSIDEADKEKIGHLNAEKMLKL